MNTLPPHPEADDAVSEARTVRLWFCLLWLAMVIGVIVLLAMGGRPDPQGGTVTLDGPWLFHVGDDPRWAAPDADEKRWDRIALVSRPDSRDGDVGIPGYLDGWRARGHPALEGFGWYRRRVGLPQARDLVLVGPPSVDDGYEAYWNGQPIGGVGRLSGVPKVNAVRPRLMPLPIASGETEGVLAIRAYMQPGFDRDRQSGGLRTVPVLAPRADGEALYRAQWRRTIAGYVVDAAEPLAMLVLAVVAGLAAPGLPRPGFARWMAAALIVSGLLRLGNAISAWTDLLSAPQLIWQNGVILTPLAKFVWTMAWNHWAEGRDQRAVTVAALAGWLILVVAALYPNALIDGTGRAIFALCLAVIAIRILRRGADRGIALTALVLTAVGLFAGDLSALGVPGIWFPFGIGVSRSQYAGALALPLIAFALTASSLAVSGRAATAGDR